MGGKTKIEMKESGICNKQEETVKGKCLRIKCNIAFFLCVVLFISIFGDKSIFIKAKQPDIPNSEELNQFFCVRQSVTENGRVIYRGSGSDIKYIKDGLMYQLEKSDVVCKQDRSEGMEFISSDTIYSSKSYMMSSAQNQYSGILIAEKDIRISGNTSKLDGGPSFQRVEMF